MFHFTTTPERLLRHFAPKVADRFTDRGAFETLALMRSVSRERRQLARLDRQALKDLGIDPADAAREAARPFWDLPKQRRP